MNSERTSSFFITIAADYFHRSKMSGVASKAHLKRQRTSRFERKLARAETSLAGGMKAERKEKASRNAQLESRERKMKRSGSRRNSATSRGEAESQPTHPARYYHTAGRHLSNRTLFSYSPARSLFTFFSRQLTLIYADSTTRSLARCLSIDFGPRTTRSAAVSPLS